MKKFLFLILTVALFTMLTACSKTPETEKKIEAQESLNTANIKDDGSNTNFDLKFEKALYHKDERDGIKIYYPELVGGIDLKTQELINQTIFCNIIGFTDDYYNGYGDNDYTLELDYTFEIIDNRIISICFKGLCYKKGYPYPVNIFRTVNIDIGEAEQAIKENSDIYRGLFNENIIEINSDLVEIIKKNAKNVSEFSQHDNLLKEYDSDTMLSVMTGEEFTIYLKRDVIGFSFPVSHALGDYVNFEINTEFLKEFLKI